MKIFYVNGNYKDYPQLHFLLTPSQPFFLTNILGVGGVLESSHNDQTNAFFGSLCLINELVADVIVEFRIICSSSTQPIDECAQECLHTV